MAGALAYSLLRPFGLDYLRSYFLTAALVTLLTSALCTAIAASLLYRVVLDWTSSVGWALAAALGYGLGHHGMAVYRHAAPRRDGRRLPLHRLLFHGRSGRSRVASFSVSRITTSMLAWVVTAILAVYFLLCSRADPPRTPSLRRRRHRRSSRRCSSTTRSRSATRSDRPMFVEWPLRSSCPLASTRESGALLWEYAAPRWSATRRSRCSVSSAPRSCPPARRRERNLLLALARRSSAFVVFVHADGACQYGPRMLLPALPFAALGVAGFATMRRQALAATVVAVTASISAGINLLGALYGTHFCPHDRYAVERYLAAVREGVGVSLPLLGPLGAPRGEASRESDRAARVVSAPGSQLCWWRGTISTRRACSSMPPKRWHPTWCAKLSDRASAPLGIEW